MTGLRRSLRLPAVLAATVLALPAVAATHDPLAAPPAGANCILGLSLGHCADASAGAAVSCTVAGGNYSCDLSTSWGVAGSSGAALGGDAGVVGWLDITVCDDLGCTQSLQHVGAPCSWSLGGHGCSTSGSFAQTASGPHATCVEVYVSIQVDVQVSPAGVPLTLVQDQAYAPSSFSDC